MDSETTPHAFQFTSTDGLRIACARWDSHEPSRGIVQIAHGLGEHIGRYLGLIEVLVGAGLGIFLRRFVRTG
jgi:alpha-beta hydrolase superfamily lysophospholipase